ncbi:uncharacterized protein LOC112084554 [Eutrema salsugineum]|uniref:uncharacterized protein LOC112084554 n=1 Tax=Eutrema salsugineum TaxID=72664 RepID=UPI000CED3057|nr:uncharacterized protein LOC112084554 [Eutrema salsugineum]
MENILLATEIVKYYHKPSVTPRCAMKIDISKAFDSVQWPFLLNIMQALDFPDVFICWINRCITSASFSVQVNGELTGYFGSKRGLRQGCSLSPYLFVMFMNVLSCKIDMAAADRKFGYHPNCKNLSLTHLCLSISLEKSTLYTAGVSDELPVKYLGLPLLIRKMNATDYLPLIENIQNRINSWTARALSFAGRLQLIRSVIFSIKNFWIAAFRLPKACITEIDRLCSAFLWSGPALNSKKAKVAWKDICTPKDEGGLGLRSITETNKVSCLKLIWRIQSTRSLWTVKHTTSLGSWMWKFFLKYRHLAKQFYAMEIRSGSNTSFWHDPWCELGCLLQRTGERGVIDLGIPLQATVGDALDMPRRRRHRRRVYKEIEEQLQQVERQRTPNERDIAKWKGISGTFKGKFSSQKTWKQIRLLTLVHDMLPGDNVLPTSTDDMKKFLKVFGFGYDVIHACKNDCILYRKQYEDKVSYPRCNASRWEKDKHTGEEKKGIPAKVLRYFPIKNRFKRMFRSTRMAENLQWHFNNASEDGTMRHPVDSITWTQVNSKWPQFAAEPRNLRLGLSTDGINPFSIQNTKYSTWPVLLVNYNMPPTMCMKAENIMVTMLIPGPTA